MILGTQSKIAETYKKKRKLNRKDGREITDDKLFTINFSFPFGEWRHHLREGCEMSPPSISPTLHPEQKISRNMCLMKLNQQALHYSLIILLSQAFLSQAIKLKMKTTMEERVQINTSFDKFYFSFKIITIRDSQQKKKKKRRRETKIRRRIK